MDIDFTNLKKMVDEKYISVQKHLSMPISIYNYTQKAQFDHLWNNETKQCRGLILDQFNNIVARPFPKFFNLSEHTGGGGQIPSEDFVVTEKMDGSLGILYWDGNMPRLATRGSFVSDQAIKGTQMLHNGEYGEMGFNVFNKQYTYLFEIIYPENRIVVDYGGYEGLVLLSVIDTKTGSEQSYETMMDYAPYMKVVKKYDAIKDLSKIESRPNAEGYVIYFPTSNQRFKVKFDEYVRLHRLVTGVNAKTIWELLKNGQPFEELMDRVPDEFFEWVRTTKDFLLQEYQSIERQAIDVYATISKISNRKDQAVEIMKTHKNLSGILFKMLDKKPFDDIIWKMVRPEATKPFKEDIEV